MIMFIVNDVNNLIAERLLTSSIDHMIMLTVNVVGRSGDSVDC
jgi:hypothetical protein